MNQESQELKEKMAQLSDEELLKLVTVETEDYRQEALEHAKAELMERGIDFARAAGEPDSGREDSLLTDPLHLFSSPGFTGAPLDASGLVCLACGGQMREGTLVTEKQLTIIFADNKEERFVRVDACSRCGLLSLVVDYERD